MPEHEVRKCVDYMSFSGVRVKYYVFPGQDHFLFFSEPERVLSEIGAWLADE